MSHTPGPWTPTVHNLPIVRRIKMTNGEADTFQASIRSANERRDLICRLDFGYGRKNDEANARLIAAAPELLEHLKDMVRRFEGCLVTNGTDREFARGATVHARAVIAKAEQP